METLRRRRLYIFGTYYLQYIVIVFDRCISVDGNNFLDGEAPPRRRLVRFVHEIIQFQLIRIIRSGNFLEKLAIVLGRNPIPQPILVFLIILATAGKVISSSSLSFLYWSGDNSSSRVSCFNALVIISSKRHLTATKSSKRDSDSF